MTHAMNRNAIACVKLRQEMGASGYGIYRMLVELADESGGGVPYDPELLAFALGVTPGEIRQTAEGYGLFALTGDGATTGGGDVLTPTAQPLWGLCREVTPQSEGAQRTATAAAGGNYARNDRKEEKKQRKDEEKERSKGKEEEKKKRKEETDDDVDGAARKREASATVEAETAALLRDGAWLGATARNHGTTADRVTAQAAAFCTECRANGKTCHASLDDARRHFNSWLRIRLQAERADAERGAQHEQKATTYNHKNISHDERTNRNTRTAGSAPANALRRGAEPSAMGAKDYEGRF